MRRAVLALVIGLSLSAFAQEGDLLLTRIHVPGQGTFDKELSVSVPFLKTMGFTDGEVAKIQRMVQQVNGQRTALFGKLVEAREKFLEAQDAVNDAIAAIRKEEEKLHDDIQALVPDETKKANYQLLVELLPTISWLKLTDAQVQAIVAKVRPLLAAGDPREKVAQAAAEIKVGKLDADARKQHIKMLQDYRDFEAKWREAIRSELTPEQQKLWDARYRRTLQATAPPVDDGGGF
jgi:hypothetical protein